MGDDPLLPQRPQILSDQLRHAWHARKLIPGHSHAKRLPITPDLLRKLHAILSRGPPSFDEVMLWAACCQGFFGFMRAGEFTKVSPTEDTLSVADVSVDLRDNPQVLAVLHRRKTDPFGAGVHLYVGRTGDVLCPVTAVLGYLAIRPPSIGPLLLFEDGTPLSRTRLITHMRAALSQAGVDTAGYSGHSFRIRAASTAARAGFKHAIQ